MKDNIDFISDFTNLIAEKLDLEHDVPKSSEFICLLSEECFNQMHDSFKEKN